MTTHPESVPPAEESGAATPPEQLHDVADLTAIVREKIDLPPTANERLFSELKARRESGEIHLDPFPFELIDELVANGEALQKKHLQHRSGKPQALVLFKDDLEVLGGLELVFANGLRTTIDRESFPEGDVFTIYPDQLGDE